MPALDPGKAAELKEHLERMLHSLASRADQGDLLRVPREVDHFVYFDSGQAAAVAAGRLEHAGWNTEVTGATGGPGASGFTLRAYREEAVDAGTAEHSMRTVFAIATAAGGTYDGYGARLVFPEDNEPPGIFSRLFGRGRNEE